MTTEIESLQRSYLRTAIRMGARLTVGENDVFAFSAQPGMGDLLKLAGFEFVDTIANKGGTVERYKKSSVVVVAPSAPPAAPAAPAETKPDMTVETKVEAVAAADTTVPVAIAPEQQPSKSQSRRKYRE